jgi:hypothetical protein
MGIRHAVLHVLAKFRTARGAFACGSRLDLMRLVIAAALVLGCAARPSPYLGLSINHRTLDPTPPGTPIDVGIGSTIALDTAWEELCPERGHPEDTGTVSCNEVKHRVHVRCAEPCRITAPDGRVRANALTWGPTASGARFRVETTAGTLSLQVCFEHAHITCLETVPEIRFVVPSEIIIECELGTVVGACDRELPADRALVVRIREPAGVSLGDVRIDGKLVPYGYAPIGDLVPVNVTAGDKPRIQPGDYRMTVEVNPAPHTIRRELTLRLR